MIRALGLALLLTATSALWAQDKPWQRPGSRVGEEIIGPDGGRMVWVPAGEFTMGSNSGHPDERPEHRVRLSKGFWVGKCEVSVGQWKRYSRDSGAALPDPIFVPDSHPIAGVDWAAYQAYCRYYGLAMLTEAQWEWAARGPEGRQYPWGNQWDASRCCNNDNPGPDGYTSPVGSHPAGASWCGALDMAGNLAEWVGDWYAENYYANSPAVDPTGPATGVKRVQRGGYCWADADWCRTTERFADNPANDGGAGTLRVCYTP